MTVIIPDGSLALQRMLNEANLPASAQVQAQVSVENTSGGFSRSWTTTATLPCRLGNPGGALERLVAGGSNEDILRVPVTFAAGVQVATSARLVITWDDAGTPRTVTFSIIGREDIRTRAQSARYICEVVR